MRKTEKIELNFGNPEHGWLPVEFKYGEFELDFDASDVPKIPTDLLCESHVSILKGFESKMNWFLEPGHYLFEFIPNGVRIDLLISASRDSIIKQKGSKKISGDFDSIILPMYRALKKFNTIEFNELDWEKIDRIKLDELTELINKRKTAYNNV